MITDKSGPFVRVWIMDSANNQLAVRRDRRPEVIAEWIVDTLFEIAAEQTPACGISGSYARH